jgi:ATP-binding protein involved in chromosome partitioning
MTDEQTRILKNLAGALKTIVHPRTGKDVVSSGLVSRMKRHGPGEVSLSLATTPADPPGLADEVHAAAISVEGVESVKIEARSQDDTPKSARKLPVMNPDAGGGKGPAQGPERSPPASQAPQEPQSIPGIRSVIAVSSGKGGVGKSTVAANLAAGLAARGAKVGLMDADVYGPNIPIMFGVYSRPQVTADERVVPLEAYGVKLMSIGFLLDEDTPAIWRGPIVQGIIRQFLQQVDWGDLDYLVVDMPPGTGDAQLSLVQLVKVDGAIMITTPQGVATADVLKGIKMFERVEVPVLGLVENMAGFVCPHCGEGTDIFGAGGGEKLAATAGIQFLGSIPLGATVVNAGDSGRPTVVGEPESAEAKAMLGLADKVAGLFESAGASAD